MNTQKFRVFPYRTTAYYSNVFGRFAYGTPHIVYAIRQPGCTNKYYAACQENHHAWCIDYRTHALAMELAQEFAASVQAKTQGKRP